MINVKAENRLGITTSIILHSDGNYPVWFENSKTVEFINKENVIFI
jgi:hypothetical protein